MKKEFVRATAAALAAAMVFSLNTTTYAAEVSSTEDQVTISEKDKPYLSLGEDLTEKQRDTVLDLMGIDPANLEDYDVCYVTNKEEHELLGDYISSSKIGKRALSSVVITEAKKGSGLSISTYNINYCTVGMYKNALATAGITDVNVIVAGPFSISGTAALVGVIKAYSEMTGEEIQDEVVDAALDELVTTGQLEEALGDKVSQEDLEALIAELKKELANGALDSETSMEEAIDRVAKEYGVTLDSAQKQKLMELLKKMKSLDLDWDVIADQAEYWASKIGKFANSVSADDVDSFISGFEKFINSILGFFKFFS